ncbi:la-related protein 7-like [Plasmopara halstedii]|uniref:La-related protein 7-like n=1 Tax=Plasmopara halstedii TaxID=4781 RepID=A0A0P1AQC6_PLAHL|nr:la-related protein 7-like [Plasmopara halstedii]CEG43727.1 la-related protein 7-like [Plasmopara halstedii]|eukprot:XP_024580096.1 la-related protein 7-like [Plasmopara halstedii]
MSLRKRLQRQLEFYMSESNIRQDTFLRHEMDDDGFVPVHVFLTFNKLKVLKATERMILDEAEKSSLLRADRVRCCIAPKTLPLFGQMDDVDARTLYFDNFSALDNHESLRQTFARFGKVNLNIPKRVLLTKQ